jgi:hypothetical protein
VNNTLAEDQQSGDEAEALENAEKLKSTGKETAPPDVSQNIQTTQKGKE